MRAHGEYLSTLFESGRLYAGGPFIESSGGMVIVRAASMEEMQAFLAMDPAIVSGAFVAQVDHWWPRFRGEARLPPPTRPAPQ